MEKETVILRLKTSIDFGQETISWLNQVSNIVDEQKKDNEIWFAKENGKYFLSKFKDTWQQAFTEEVDLTVQNYFLELGFDKDFLPKTKIIKSYSGSWVMEAAVTIASTIGGTYVLIKGVSEIPDMVEGLTKLKDIIAKKFHRRVDKEATDLLSEQAAKHNNLPSLPHHVMQTKDFVLDDKPLASLKPNEMESPATDFARRLQADEKFETEFRAAQNYENYENYEDLGNGTTRDRDIQ